MPSFNKVILIGNLTSDAVLHKVPGNYVLTEFRFAIDQVIKAKKTTVFIDVVAWGNVAVNAAKYLSKGQAIQVEGRLQYQQWTDKTTKQSRSKHNVVADNIVYLDKRESPRAFSPLATSEANTKSAESNELPEEVKTPTTAISDHSTELPWYDKDSKAYADNSNYGGSPFDDDYINVPYRDEEVIYRDEINHDEWKDKVTEFNKLSRERDRTDLSQQDHDDLEERIEELREEIEKMQDITSVAHSLPRVI